MTLRLMQDVVATVDDQWQSPLADELMSSWAHDGRRALFWRASANFIFFFKNQGWEYALRFNHADERTAVGLEADDPDVTGAVGDGVALEPTEPGVGGRLA